MKRYISIATALLLTTGIFTACGCQNVSERVDGMITEATGMMPTVTTEPTHETTRPTTATTPSAETTRPGDAATDTTGDTRPTTDFSRAPENVNGGTNYWMDPKEDAGTTAPSDTARTRGRMDGRN